MALTGRFFQSLTAAFPALIRFGRKPVVVVVMAVTLVSTAALGALEIAGVRLTGLAPVSPRARELSDTCYAMNARGESADAIPVCREAVRIAPHYAVARKNLGLALRDAGSAEQAIPVLREAIRLDPGMDKAHNVLANALRDTGDLSQAIAEYREAIRINPGYAKAHNNLGWALGLSGQREEALPEYRAAVRFDPNYLQAYGNLGRACYQTGRFGEAEKAFGELVRRDPSAESYWNLGLAQMHRGARDEAITTFQAAVQINPNHAGAWNNLGCLLLQKKRFGEALAALDQSEQLLPGPGVLLNRGVALYGLGRRAAARQLWKQVLAMPGADQADSKATPASLARELLKAKPL